MYLKSEYILKSLPNACTRLHPKQQKMRHAAIRTSTLDQHTWFLKPMLGWGAVIRSGTVKINATPVKPARPRILGCYCRQVYQHNYSGWSIQSQFEAVSLVHSAKKRMTPGISENQN